MNTVHVILVIKNTIHWCVCKSSGPEALGPHQMNTVQRKGKEEAEGHIWAMDMSWEARH
jgi:hypothetical protein